MCGFGKCPAECVCIAGERPAQVRILKVEGKIFTFDQLALESPKNQSTVLFSGPQKGQELYRYFDKTQEIPYSHTKPYICSKVWKFKHARGQKASQGYRK